MSYKIVIDSCGELLDEWKKDPRFESVALTLSVGGENIIDDENFDQASFLKKVADCPECPKSACPSPERGGTAPAPAPAWRPLRPPRRAGTGTGRSRPAAPAALQAGGLRRAGRPYGHHVRRRA